jgi:hypothetical protein
LRKVNQPLARQWRIPYENVDIPQMPKPSTVPADLSGATAKDILALSESQGVRFLRLQFTDILGINKNVEVPASQFPKA